MSAPTIAEYLSYANLQIAAESFVRDEATNQLDNTGDRYLTALTNGNLHSSRFVTTQADKFATEWEVLDQKANTKTGFSGTLFRNRETRETVLSFRSTEFIDDAARDNKATNDLEIKNTGFAWGQIADMQAWYAELKADQGKLGGGQAFSVTGYSLGGHLATAFNLLNAGAAQRVVTFNGAGVGQMKDGTLAGALQDFNMLRGSTDELAARFTETGLAATYRTIREGLASGSMTAASAQTWLQEQYTDPVSGQARALGPQAQMLQTALREIDAIAKEAVRVTTLVAGGTGEGASARPKEVMPQDIAGLDLNYRLAMQWAGQHARSASLAAGAVQGYGDKRYGSPRLENQYDVVGDTKPSVVSNSQWHHGQDVRIGIEDQPLYRGGIVTPAMLSMIPIKGPDLLVDQYVVRDFGDTHSLVLLVDSLSLQNTLLSLVPPEQRTQDSAKELFKALYEAATDKEKVNGDALVGAGQGKSEGDLLENLVNALADTVLGPQDKATRLKGNTEGGTWARTKDEDGYSGRDRFYAVLEKVQKGIDDLKLDKPFALASTGAATALIRSARSDFGDYLALQTLSPFALHMAQAQAGQDAIGARWGAAYTDWKSDKQALAAGQSTSDLRISDQWLTDRAALLERKNAFGVANLHPFDLTPIAEQSPRATAPYHGEDTYYEDADTGYKVRQGAFTSRTRSVYFGDGEDNQFFGRTGEDHLYGGDGSDTLDGKGGADYLEGGSGNDVLIGGEGHDTLVGGTGNDTYRFEGRFGNDTVLESDGQDAIFVGSGAGAVKLTGGKKVADNVWESEDQRFVFTQRGVDLIIGQRTGTGAETSEGTIRVRNWKPGQVGITLQDAAPQALLAPARNYDLASDDGLDAYRMALPSSATQSMLIRNAAAAHNVGTKANPVMRSAWASGGQAGDVIEGGGTGAVSNIVLAGGGGDDRVYAGVAMDLAEAIAQGDAVQTVARAEAPEAKPDQKLLSQWMGPEATDAGKDAIPTTKADTTIATGQIVLDGGAGDDTLVGGAGRDLLLGGAGDDTLLGGAGGDIIFGDGNAGGLLGGDRASETDPLILDGPATEAGTNALLRIDHEGLTVGTTGTDSTGQGRRLVVMPGTQTLYPLYAVDYSALAEVNDRDIRGQGYVYPSVVLGYGGPLTADKPTGQHTSYLGNAADGAFSTNRERGDDVIYAGAGDDLVNAGAGDDVVFGGSGNDSVAGYEGNDTIEGGSGNDLLLGDALVAGPADSVVDFYSASLVTRYTLDAGQHGSDLIDGGEGNDVIEGGGRGDLLSGGAGDDMIFGDDAMGRITGAQAGDDLLEGNAGDDMLFGGAGVDALNGGEGKDFLVGDWKQDDGAERSSTADLLDGGAGDDLLYGAAGDDVLLGGDGADLLRGDATVAADTQALSVEFETEGPNARILYSDAQGSDTLDGGAGDDQLYGDGGDDVLMGGEGRDRLEGGTGNDVLQGGQGQDSLFGGDGNDVLDGGAGVDYLAGGAGNDTYRIAVGDAVAQVNAQGVSEGETIEDVEGTNVLQIEGAGLDDLVVTARADARSGASVVLHVGASASQAGDVVLIAGGSVSRTIERVQAGQESIDFETLVNRRLQTSVNIETSGNGQYLLGGARSDVLKLSGTDGLAVAGRGDDRIVLSGSRNAVRVGRGDGNDVIARAPAAPAVGNKMSLMEADVGAGRASADVTGADPGQAKPPGNAVMFGPGIRREDLVLTRAAAGAIRVSVKEGDASVTIQGGGVDTVQFSPEEGSNPAPAVDLVAWAQSELLPEATAGNDWMEGLLFNDTMAGGMGNDVLMGFDGSDTLFGDAGDDFLLGGAGDDVLSGGVGSDNLNGGEGSDTLVSDGADYLDGGLGDDVYRISFSEASATETSSVGMISDKSGASRIEMTNGPEDFRDYAVFSEEGLVFLAAGKAGVIALDDGVDYSQLTLAGPSGQEMNVAALIAAQNASGKVDSGTWSRETGVVWDHASASGKVITGTAGDDLLSGGAGDDKLFGVGGNDQLVGGRGRDVLIGGMGANRYVFNRGDGVDAIQATGGEVASLEFSSIDAGSIRGSIIGNDFRIDLGQGDEVYLSDYVGNEQAFEGWSVLAGGRTRSFGDFFADKVSAASMLGRKNAFAAAQYVELRTQRQYLQDSGWGDNKAPSSVTQTSFQLTGGAFEYQPYLVRTTISHTVQTTTLVPRYENRNTPTGYNFIPLSYWPPTFPYAGIPIAVSAPVQLQPGSRTHQSPQEIVGYMVQTSGEQTESELVGWDTQVNTRTVVSYADQAVQSTIMGTAAADTVINSSGAQLRGVIETGAGNDDISIGFDGSGVDTVALASSAPANMNSGLRGMGAWIDAGSGNDTVRGSDASDVIVGGTGSDHLDGAEGADVYVISAPLKGDVDTITDHAFTESIWIDAYGGMLNQDVIEFDETVQLKDLSYRWIQHSSNASLKVLELVMDNKVFLQVDYSASSSRQVGVGVEQFKFSDGRTLNLEVLTHLLPISTSVDPYGDPYGNAQGTFTLDATVELSQLSYQWAVSENPDTVRLVLFQNGVELVEFDYDATVELKDRTESVSGINYFEFSDGNGFDLKNLIAAIPMQPAPPVISKPLADAFALEDQTFSLLMPTDAFADSQHRELIYTAKLQDGTSLPEWLRLDEKTGRLSGIPDNAHVGGMSIVMTATNDAGLSVSDTFELTVANVNDAPIAGPGLLGQQGRVGEALRFALPSGAFRDEDTGDHLRLSAVLQGATPLPAWLSFDAATGTFSGTPPTGAAGTLSVQITATDDAGATATQSLSLVIAAAANPGKTVTGTAGDDTLRGGSGDDILDGGLGNDKLYGGLGNNTYRFGRGDGQDRLTFLYDTAAGKLNTLQLKNGVVAADVALRRDGANLVVSIAGTADQVTVENFLYLDDAANVWNPLQQIRFDDGTAWDLGAIQTRLFATTAGADTLRGTAGNDVFSGGLGDDNLNGAAGNDRLSGDQGNDLLYGEAGDDVLEGGEGNDTLYGDAGNDTLDGGSGIDTLYGGLGDNTYRFGRGDGQDRLTFLYDTTAAKRNTLLLKPGVAAADVALRRDGSNLVVSITGTADQITVENFLYLDDAANLWNPMQQIRFDDGTTWGLDAIQTRLFAGTNAADTVRGSVANDTLSGGVGDDNLNGAAGNDILLGGQGNDSLYGESGDDVLEGGAGNDTLFGGLGNNTYVFGRGDGQDRLTFLYDATAAKRNTLQFKAGVTTSDVGLRRDGDHLIVSIAGTSDQITVENFMYSNNTANAWNPLQQIRFDDGTQWGLEAIVQHMGAQSKAAVSILPTNSSGAEIGDNYWEGQAKPYAREAVDAFSVKPYFLTDAWSDGEQHTKPLAMADMANSDIYSAKPYWVAETGDSFVDSASSAFESSKPYLFVGWNAEDSVSVKPIGLESLEISIDAQSTPLFVAPVVDTSGVSLERHAQLLVGAMAQFAPPTAIETQGTPTAQDAQLTKIAAHWQ